MEEILAGNSVVTTRDSKPFIQEVEVTGIEETGPMLARTTEDDIVSELKAIATEDKSLEFVNGVYAAIEVIKNRR